VKRARLAALTLAAALVLGCAGPGQPGPRAAAPAPAPGTPVPGASAPSLGARLAAPDPLSPQSTLDLLRNVTPPARDEADLVRRFKSACGTPTAPAVPLYVEGDVGQAQTFWVLDQVSHTFLQVPATLRHATPHLLLFVQDGAPYSQEALAASAKTFEEKTYPLLRRFFGDVPAEPRLTVFNGRVPGVGGYFSSSDLFPKTVNPYSNERVMVFMSLDATRPGTSSYDAVLAHETQHFLHWLVKPQQDSWINEGASELAMAVSGYDQSSAARSYLNNPETQVNAWAERPWQTQPHYGAGYLMLEYLAQRLGGYEQIKDLIASRGTSVQTYENYLAGPAGKQIGASHFDDLFRDFVVANLLNDRSLADGRFGYERLAPLKARTQETLTAYPATSAGRLRPYGTRYVEVQPPAGGEGTLEVRFSGAGEVQLFGAPAHNAGRVQWWGNAADEMESTLTREVDLGAVSQATLHFSAWYNVERDYDYAGVAVSTDRGCSWQTLPGQYTTDSNPVGQNLGYGLTGVSGGGTDPVWVDETMDLSPFAGQRVLLRFFYITDQSYHGPGFAVDDVSIPEIGFADDAETDQGWQASGFLRSVNASALDWGVQVIAFADGGIQVRQVPLAPGGDGKLQGSLRVERFGSAVRRVVVAVSPLVPVTLEGADYRLEAAVR
jgi:immune inhibitor A